MKKIKFLLLSCMFIATTASSQSISNGSFESGTAPSCSGNDLEVLKATGWHGLRDAYNVNSCATHTGANSTTSWITTDPALFVTGMSGGCIPLSTQARTGNRWVVLESASGTSARNELVRTQVSGLTVGQEYKFTTFVNPVQTLSASDLQQMIAFVLTGASTPQAMVDAAQSAYLAMQQPVVTELFGGDAGWFRVEQEITATATAMNLLFGFVWCNDAFTSFAISVDDFSMQTLCIANAGPDQNYLCTCCLGQPCQPVTIGTPAVPGMNYVWTPSSSLSNPLIAQPIASPLGTVTYTVTVSGANCVTNTDAVLVTKVLGTCCPAKNMSIDDDSEQNMVTIFPNPSGDGLINVLLNNDEEILAYVEVFDITGKLVLAENFTKPQFLVDISSAGSGVYTIVTNVNGTSYQSKVVVQ